MENRAQLLALVERHFTWSRPLAVAALLAYLSIYFLPLIKQKRTYFFNGFPGYKHASSSEKIPTLPLPRVYKMMNTTSMKGAGGL